MPRKKILLGVSLFAVFLAAVVGIAFYLSSGLASVIQQQLVAIRAQDIVKAYSYTSDEFKSATSLGDFEDFVNHYAVIKNNQKITVIKEEMHNNLAVVTGVLYAVAGTSMPIEYTLVKEEGAWKIMGIQVDPAGELTDLSAKQSVSDSTAMTNIYDNKDSRYTVKYPANWEYERTGDGTVIFSGKRGTNAFFSTVNIQTVLSKKTGGDYSTVKQFVADIKQQAMSQSQNVKFLESGSLVVTEKSGAKDRGEYIVFVYKYKGKEFKQWQVVILRDDEQVFYAWAYTSPMQQYPKDVGVAKAMLSTWTIY